MQMPWTNTTGLAKAVAIFATGLVICLGLCGLNFVAFMTGVDSAHSILVLTAYLELAGMAICAAGLIAALIIGVLRAFYRQFSGHSEFSKLNLRQSASENLQIAPTNEKEDK